MLRKMLTTTLVFLSAVVLAGADVTTTLTGCLQRDKGVMYYVQEGSAPMRPCEQGDRIISFNQTGPQGPAGPPGPAAPAPPRFRFVGVTSVRLPSYVGWLAMTRACAQRYPSSRMAFSDEIKTTISIPDIPETAWVQPRMVGGLTDLSVFDATGNRFPASVELDCRSWTDPNHGGGGVVTAAGAITTSACDSILAVACAAPEP